MRPRSGESAYCEWHARFPDLSINSARFAEGENIPYYEPGNCYKEGDPPTTAVSWEGPTKWEKEFVELHYPDEKDLRESGIIHFTSFAWGELDQLR